MKLLSQGSAIIPPLLAIALHELVLRRVEVDRLVVPGIIVSAILSCALAANVGLTTTIASFINFWGFLSIWILLYRAFWHPLRRYPGPFAARLSKLWVVKQVWDTKYHYHRTEQQLQRQYGDYVRTGPREISIFDPNAIKPILGGLTVTSKGPVYDSFETSLHLTRDKTFHRQQRRIWDTGMKASLPDISPMIEEFTEQLLTRLRNENGKPIPLLRYFSYYSYDVMSKLAFGKSTGFIKGEQSAVAASVLNTLASSMETVGFLNHVPWVQSSPGIGALAQFAGPLREWQEWTISEMNERLHRKDDKRDLVGHLIENTPKDAAGLKFLYGQSRLIITAGSETTATALTFIFIQLAAHSSYIHALRKEYRDNQGAYHCSRPLPLLEAVINESMRLWPSVFFGAQRVTPPTGMRINDRFIPGNTIVQIPPFPVNRDPRNYVRPDEFLPERWTTHPEWVLNEGCFLPFSTGPYNCAGKATAMMELRSVTARVVNEFDVRLPEDFVAEQYFENVKSHFTAGPPSEQVISFVKV